MREYDISIPDSAITDDSDTTVATSEATPYAPAGKRWVSTGMVNRVRSRTAALPSVSWTAADVIFCFNVADADRPAGTFTGNGDAEDYRRPSAVPIGRMLLTS